MSLARVPSRAPISGLALAIAAGGLLAGLALGVFHTVATEPLVDAAIAIEEMSRADVGGHPPVVSRDAQRTGLVVGSVVYGFIFAALLGVAYTLARGRSWLRPGWGGALGLAAFAYWAVAFFPSLKYPANPPGVGDPETIGYRQALFVLCWGLAILGAIGSAALARQFSALSGRAAAVALLTYGAWSVAVYLLLPPNPDPVPLPEDLVTAFRARATVGLTVFWAILGAVLAIYAQRETRRDAAAV